MSYAILQVFTTAGASAGAESSTRIGRHDPTLVDALSFLVFLPGIITDAIEGDPALVGAGGRRELHLKEDAFLGITLVSEDFEHASLLPVL